MFSGEEQKLKGMNGTCIYAYEFDSALSPLRSKSSSPANQTFSDIQRNSHARKRKLNAKCLLLCGMGLFFQGPPS